MKEEKRVKQIQLAVLGKRQYLWVVTEDGQLLLSTDKGKEFTVVPLSSNGMPKED